MGADGCSAAAQVTNISRHATTTTDTDAPVHVAMDKAADGACLSHLLMLTLYLFAMNSFQGR